MTADAMATSDSDVVALLDELITIDSVNPDLVPGASGEARIAEFVIDWLIHRGFTCQRLEDRPGRPSVVATARGRGGGRSLMLNGHLDTVSLASYDGDGLAPQHRDGKVFGRGAYDMKSGVAAIMVAANVAKTHELRGDVVLALVADEEHSSAGTAEVLRHYSADAAVVVEPSGLDLVLAHLGFAWFEVVIEGIAAHGSRPDLGIDAITKAGKFLVELERHASNLTARSSPHPLLSAGSLHASVIDGGQELSSYPARCTIGLERRTTVGEDTSTVEAELRSMLEAIARDDPDFRYTLRAGLHRSPFAADPDHPIATTISRCFERLVGRPIIRRGERFWTDCALLADAGIPAVLFGVDGAGAHAATEWVTIDSLRDTTRVLIDTLVEYCN
jgi:acetylornithine deacetylase